MSIYFGFLNGKPYDYKFKKIRGFGEDDSSYLFYLGDTFICQLYKEKRKGWLVIVEGDLRENPEVPRMVKGFKSRQNAIDYALKVHPNTRETYK